MNKILTLSHLDGLAVFKLDLAQLSVRDGEAVIFNLLIYAKNLKGESEKTLLENIAFNDAARRTGKLNQSNLSIFLPLSSYLIK